MPQPSASVRNYASILVPMDLDGGTEDRLKLAVDMADRFRSRLIGTVAQPVIAPLYFEAPAAGVASVLELQERQAKADAARAEALFRKVAAGRANLEWRAALAYPLDHVLRHARAADLIVAARPQSGEPNPMAVDAGGLVMEAGRPVLFVPPKADRLSGKRVVVGWKDTREARLAVAAALPLLEAADDVIVVSVQTSDDAAKDVVAYLAGHGIPSYALSAPKPSGSAGDELVRIARHEGADLIVCGAYGHSRTREWAFGGVTNDLLSRSPVCCLMAH